MLANGRKIALESRLSAIKLRINYARISIIEEDSGAWWETAMGVRRWMVYRVVWMAVRRVVPGGKDRSEGWSTGWSRWRYRGWLSRGRR